MRDVGTLVPIMEDVGFVSEITTAMLLRKEILTMKKLNKRTNHVEHSMESYASCSCTFNCSSGQGQLIEGQESYRSTSWSNVQASMPHGICFG